VTEKLPVVAHVTPVQLQGVAVDQEERRAWLAVTFVYLEGKREEGVGALRGGRSRAASAALAQSQGVYSRTATARPHHAAWRTSIVVWSSHEMTPMLVPG